MVELVGLGDDIFIESHVQPFICHNFFRIGDCVLNVPIRSFDFHLFDNQGLHPWYQIWLKETEMMTTKKKIATITFILAWVIGWGCVIIGVSTFFANQSKPTQLEKKND